MPLLRAKEETLSLVKLAKSLYEATADGSSGSILDRDHETKKRNYHNRLRARKSIVVASTHQPALSGKMSVIGFLCQW
jgi:hypothetical protein